jgi:hypothetical protein
VESTYREVAMITLKIFVSALLVFFSADATHSDEIRQLLDSGMKALEIAKGS